MSNPANGVTRMLLVGCGAMAREHLRRLVKQQATTEITAIVEPSAAMLDAATPFFEAAGLDLPPHDSSLERLLSDHQGEFDTAFIITPHAYHLEQAVMCLEAGLDVLLEKPMVMNTKEAHELIRVRDLTGHLLVVAFPGSLSPEVREAVRILRAGELGELLTIHGAVWQDWRIQTDGKWRQQPEISGGGFLFDTGAHLLNTVADLAGEDFVEVAAWLDRRGTQVDILGAVMARLKSGAFVTLNACGDAFHSCDSDVRVICSDGMMRVDVWGDFFELQLATEQELTPVKLPPSVGVWEQFLAVRAHRIENPCPPEVGLRMARLWDAIQASARDGGRAVKVGG